MSSSNSSQTAAVASDVPRTKNQLLIEIAYRTERVQFLENDMEICVTLPKKTLDYCRADLKEAIATKNGDAQHVRALRRAVKRSQLNLYNAHHRELPIAQAALNANAERIVALRALLQTAV